MPPAATESLSAADRRRLRLCRFATYLLPLAAAAVTYSVTHVYVVYAPRAPLMGARPGDGTFEITIFAVNALAVSAATFAFVFRLDPIPIGRVKRAAVAALIALLLGAIDTVALAFIIGSLK